MTLFSLALRNVKKNFYNYFLYFASMVFSIMIYYTFTAIQFNEEILKIADVSQKIAAPLTASSIVIAVFSAIFIWYSNSFFTRRRKKEIGLYSLMGVKKRQIGRMLFYENTLMGILALGAGIFLGSLLSKLFAMLLIRLMGFDAVIKFTIIPNAIKSTVIAFAILFLITSIHGYAIIYRFKLVELFRAEKSREGEPKASVVYAVLSVIMISAGYWWYIQGLKITNNFIVIILITLGLTVSGTYLMFSSLVVFIIRLSRKNSRKYFRGINMIGTSQLLYRIKSHSRTLATIAVLSASTLTALSVLTSMYYDLNKKMDRNFPFSYSYFSRNRELDKRIEETLDKYPNNRLLASVEVEAVRIRGAYPKTNPRDPKEGGIYLISETDYNETAGARGMKELKLNNSSETYIVDEWHVNSLQESYTGKTMNISLKSGKKELNVTGYTNAPLFNELMLPQFIVVRDDVFKEAYSIGKPFRIKSYITADNMNSEELTREIEGIIEKENLDEKPYAYAYTSNYRNYINSRRSTGLIIFIGAFLGLVFLTATGSIIFFKQLSEANDDRERYRILKNIGVNKREIKQSISKHILFVFLLPLLVGAVHSLVAVSLLSVFLGTELYVPVSFTIGIYTLIYLGYYVLTVNSYTKIINANA